MLEVLLGRLGLKLGKTATVVIVTGLLFVTAGALFWRGMTAIDRVNARTERLTAAARDSFWKGEIEKSNAEVANARAEQAINAMATEARANAEIARLKTSLDETEKANAALPDGDRRALGRDRVRLLTQGSGARGDH